MAAAGLAPRISGGLAPALPRSRSCAVPRLWSPTCRRRSSRLESLRATSALSSGKRWDGVCSQQLRRVLQMDKVQYLRAFVIAGVLISPVASAACGATTAAVNRPASTTDDATISTRVKTALLNEPGVNA